MVFICPFLNGREGEKSDSKIAILRVLQAINKDKYAEILRILKSLKNVFAILASKSNIQSLKKHIPNLFTLGNLLCGTIAIIYALQDYFEMAAIFVFAGIILDFFDGFVARLLNVAGELGKQLDSFADVVTSGVAPGFIMYRLIYRSSFEDLDKSLIDEGLLVQFSSNDYSMTWLSYFGFILVLGAAYRLAKFNIDTRQSDSFIGLPTPAMSLFVISLPLIQINSEIEAITALLDTPYFLIGLVVLLTYLMNTELPLLALKFKKFGWSGNEFRFILIILSIMLLITVQYLAVPLIIIAYIAVSIIENIKKSKV